MAHFVRGKMLRTAIRSKARGMDYCGEHFSAQRVSNMYSKLGFNSKFLTDRLPRQYNHLPDAKKRNGSVDCTQRSHLEVPMHAKYSTSGPEFSFSTKKKLPRRPFGAGEERHTLCCGHFTLRLRFGRGRTPSEQGLLAPLHGGS